MSKNKDKNRNEETNEDIRKEVENETSQNGDVDEMNELEGAESLPEEDRLEEEVTSLKDKYTRLFAEFDNYKKRTAKERVDLMQSAGKDVITKLLPVLDDLDRAMAAMGEDEGSSSVREGVELIHAKLYRFLEQEGVKAMDAMGETFDPDFHEAITTIPAPSEDLKDKIVDVIEKGYFLNGKVLRYAKVVIGK